MSNLVHRTFFAEAEEDLETTVSMCYLRAFNSLSKYYRQYSANDIVCVFDSPSSWRKIYTKDKENCITRKLYKGNRRQNLTESKKHKLFELDNHLDKLHALFKEHSGMIVLRKKYLEADDLIAGFVQKYKDDKNIILSSDKDFIQLLDNGNVSLIDPASDKARTLAEWDYDAKYFLFEKCIRGDLGDNVQSSYPNVRSTKIKLAYTDNFLKANLMNHEFTVELLEGEAVKPHKYTTQKLFDENEMLMDLAKQPEGIRQLIDEALIDAENNRGKFDYVSFIKFCGKYNLNVILSDFSRYTGLLSGKGRNK